MSNIEASSSNSVQASRTPFRRATCSGCSGGGAWAMLRFRTFQMGMVSSRLFRSLSTLRHLCVGTNVPRWCATTRALSLISLTIASYSRVQEWRVIFRTMTSTLLSVASSSFRPSTFSRRTTCARLPPAVDSTSMTTSLGAGVGAKKAGDGVVGEGAADSATSVSNRDSRMASWSCSSSVIRFTSGAAGASLAADSCCCLTVRSMTLAVGPKPENISSVCSSRVVSLSNSTCSRRLASSFQVATHVKMSSTAASDNTIPPCTPELTFTPCG
mmetsp:Transcript_8868/g.18876  ORF Transcript_8868/g.18876 Transcript_8868/m.18876 type:complete len:271 (-) Transcript_8868:844-1656(-)